jgi:hypothetical protein
VVLRLESVLRVPKSMNQQLMMSVQGVQVAGLSSAKNAGIDFLCIGKISS